MTDNGAVTNTTYTYNAQNQLTGAAQASNGAANTTSYFYDNNGNTVSSHVETTAASGGGASLQLSVPGDGQGSKYQVNTYDAFNQLITSCDNDSTSAYTYNGDGLRVAKTVTKSGTTTTTKFIYEYDKVVLELDSSNNQTAYNVYGGDIVMTYDYDPFGNVTAKTGTLQNSYLYAGYQFDDETGLYYLNARYYDPVVARFMSEDTYTGESDDPLSLNLYTYCKNEPMMYSDPTGHETRSMDPRMVAAYAMQAGDYAAAYAAACAGKIWLVAYRAVAVGASVGVIPLDQAALMAAGVVYAAANEKPGDKIREGGLAAVAKDDDIGIHFWAAVAKESNYVSDTANEEPSIWVIVAGMWMAISSENLNEWKDSFLKTALVTNASENYDIFVINAKGDWNNFYETDAGKQYIAGMAWEPISSNANKGTFNTTQQLQDAADKANQMIPGQGTVPGTLKHTEFANQVKGLNNPLLKTEVTYKDGKVVPYGIKGGVRLDVVEYNANGTIKAVYDLKTGKAGLTDNRIQDIQDNLPNNAPVYEIKPSK